MLKMSETDLHRSVAEYLDWVLLPPAVWTTFPAGWTALRKGAAGRLKGCGLKAGMPDILVFYNGFTVGIELKTPKGKSSDDQIAMAHKLNKAGVVVHVCRSVDEVREVLSDIHQIPMRKHEFGNTQAKGRRPPQPNAGAPAT